MLYKVGNPKVYDRLFMHYGYADAMGRVAKTYPCHINAGNSDFVWDNRLDAELAATERSYQIQRELRVYGVLASWFTDVVETDVPGKAILLFRSLVVELPPFE